MTIRTMTMDDYEKVYALWKSTAGMGMRTLDDSPEYIARFLARNPTTSFVAQEDGRIVGVMLSGNDGRRGYIYHAAVDEALRGRGIGRALLAAVLDALRKEHINRVALVVYAKNEVGNRFWESAGFTVRSDLCYRNINLNEDNV